jgi:ribosomal protein S18 acetylase RimI-like enzyme
MQPELVRVDYHNPRHGADLVHLLNHYASATEGGNQPLPAEVMAKLPATLATIPHAFSVLCYVEDVAAGLVNCFEGFSTFTCKPLVNIHDVVVVERFRGQGIARLLLEAVEKIARERGCCKITLEVLEGNTAAQKAYLKFGFDGYELDPVMGKALFWQKVLK